MTKKVWIILGILAVLAAAVFVVTKSMQEKKVNADFHADENTVVYLDQKYSFSLAYPPEWGTVLAEYSVQGFDRGERAVLSFSDNENVFISLFSSDFSEGITEGTPLYFGSEVKENSIVSGMFGYGVSKSAEFYLFPDAFDSKLNNLMIVVQEQSADNETIQDIVKTIVFENIIAKGSMFETYRDNTYGYSFTYPVDWTVEVSEGGPANDVGDVLLHSNTCTINISRPTAYKYEEVSEIVTNETFPNFTRVNNLEGSVTSRTVNEDHEVGDVYMFLLDDSHTVKIYISSGVYENFCSEVLLDILHSFELPVI